MAKNYYGPKEIKAQGIANEGPDYTALLLEDDSSVVVATSELETLMTAAPVDLTELRRMRCLPVIQSTLLLMKKFNIKQDEVEYCLSMVAESVNQNLNQASNKLWGVNNFGEQSFLQIDKVLTDK